MVRFIMRIIYPRTILRQQIYIPIWLDLLFDGFMTPQEIVERFTFQYGQIYYTNIFIERYLKAKIYIPIWLDLL